jgi:hypothetical protein
MISILGISNPSSQLAYYLLLMIPVVATIVGISRHIIGIKSLGIYAPIVLAFSFYGLGLQFDANGNPYSDITIGIRYGVLFVLVLVSSTYVASYILRKSRMNYFPKIAIIISFASLFLTAFIVVSNWITLQSEIEPFAAIFTAIFGNIQFNEITAFSLVLIASVAEKFTGVLYKKRFKKALWITLETVVTSVFCYVLLAWPRFINIIDNYKWLILLTFPINYFVGKYKGLRVREYIRFSDVLSQPEAGSVK